MAFEVKARGGAAPAAPADVADASSAPEFLRLVIDHLSDGIIVRDGGGRLIYANDSAARTCGYASAQLLVGSQPGDWRHRFAIWDEAGNPLGPADLPIERARLSRLPCEAMLRFRAGGALDDDHWVLVRATPTFEPTDGTRLRFVIGVLHDQTERKRREEDVAFRAEASTRLAAAIAIEAALASLAELAVERLASGVFVYVCPEAGALPRGVEVGGLVLIASAVDATGVAAPDAAILGHLGDGSGVSLEVGECSYIVVPMRARERDVGVLCLARAGGRRPFGAAELALSRSLASRAGLAVENARLAQEASRAVKAREDFLAVASHDMKSPLAAILFSASAVLRDAIVPRVRRAADIILRAAQGMERLVHDLVDLGAIEGGKLTLSFRRHGAGELVRGALSLLEPLASKRSVSLHLEGDPAVHDGLAVRCDRERVQQVLINLIGNAIEFSPAGAEVIVTIEARGAQVVVAVIDRGPGIPGEALPHVFDRYWQLEARGPGAVGLGLSIAKALVTAHGGDIWVESVAGSGSSFFFSLPAA